MKITTARDLPPLTPLLQAVTNSLLSDTYGQKSMTTSGSYA
jgi:hypothetical protein